MKILVAFTDAEAAETAAKMLVELGWPEPGVALTSDSAVEWINANGGCDILICEVYLTPSDGFTLRDTLMPHLPQLRVIYTSQYDITPYVERLEGAPFLPYPLQLGFLRQILGELSAPETQPEPTATAQPAATASAQPRVAAATPSVKATPVAAVATAATPSVKATPVPVAAVAATPRVTAKATPTPPVRVAAAPMSATTRDSPGTSLDLPPDERVGTTIGNYEILACIGIRHSEILYRARQTNVGRLVVLRILDNASAQDSAFVARFMANARAKARVSHTLVVAVYEGGESNGVPFYSCEYVGAPNLSRLQEQGTPIDGTTALQIIKMVADVLEFFVRQNIEHDPIDGYSILLKPGATPRMANIACQELAAPLDPCQEIRSLGEMILQCLEPSKASNPARAVAAKLRNTAEGTPMAWSEISALAQSQMPKSAPADVDKIQAQNIALLDAVKATKLKNRRNVIIGSAVSLGLTAIACYFTYGALTKSQVNVGDLGTMVEIPAGAFQFQDERITLPKFYISKYEVTIAEYADFLKHLAQNPGKAADYAHPDQPPGKSHIPTAWADMTEITPPNPGYYARAKKWGQFQGAPLTLDSPVFGVDWFDAYAYAKWKGQRLPTEQEWEKAARGKRGEIHPWGSANTFELANTGIDFTPNPDAKVGGEKDGFKRWSPVNQPTPDKSDYGVLGMAGNISEWTSSWDSDAMQTGAKVPVYRGGNWKTRDQTTATRRGAKLAEYQSDDALGFRTASDSADTQ